MRDREERREFLEDRKKGVGGSDIPAITTGVRKRDGTLIRDVLDVYHDKTRPVDEDELTNVGLLRGVMLEDDIADLYQEYSGNQLRRTPTRTHPDVPFFRVNTDRIITSDDSRPEEHRSTGAAEIKAPMSFVYEDVIEFGFPDYYIMQAQWEMFVHGYAWGVLVAGNFESERGPLVWHTMERHELLIEQLAERARIFWTEHVEPRVPPDPTEWHDLSRVEVPEVDGERVVIDDEEVRHAAHRLMKRYRLRKQAKDLYEEAKAEFEEFMAERDVTKLVVPGQGKVNYGWREGRTRLDTENLRRSMPIDRDKLVSAMADGRLQTAMAEDPIFSPADAERLLTQLDLGLDFSRFESQGSAYRAFRPYPEDHLLEPSEAPPQLEATDG